MLMNPIYISPHTGTAFHEYFIPSFKRLFERELTDNLEFRYYDREKNSNNFVGIYSRATNSERKWNIKQHVL